jgi:hypothetical protein
MRFVFLRPVNFLMSLQTQSNLVQCHRQAGACLEVPREGEFDRSWKDFCWSAYLSRDSLCALLFTLKWDPSPHPCLCLTPVVQAGWPSLYSLHLLRALLSWQIDAPLHSLYLVLPVVWQIDDPPHSWNALRCRLCWEIDAPPHSLHLLRRQLCGQIDAPPHSLHLLRCRLCWQIDDPPHSLHWLLIRLC